MKDYKYITPGLRRRRSIEDEYDRSMEGLAWAIIWTIVIALTMGAIWSAFA